MLQQALMHWQRQERSASVVEMDQIIAGRRLLSDLGDIQRHDDDAPRIGVACIRKMPSVNCGGDAQAAP